jgi:hypothetical protein
MSLQRKPNRKDEKKKKKVLVIELAAMEKGEKKKQNGDISVELLSPGELARSNTHPTLDLGQTLGKSTPPVLSQAISHAADDSDVESDDEDYLVSVCSISVSHFL